MTRVEAEAYTKNSYYAGHTFYHGTHGGTETITTNGIELAQGNPVGALGPVFYTSTSRVRAREYATSKGADNPVVLKMSLKVQNPKIYDLATDFAEEAERRGIDLAALDWEVQCVEALQSQGFDAIEVKSLGYVYVFEPMQVAVFAEV